MIEQDIDRLRKKLFTQRKEVFQELQDLNEGWDRVSERDIQTEEKAQKAELTEVFAQLDERRQREVEEIDRALTKMVDANYGICEDCKKPIPLERLLALPATRYCIKCSTMEEEKEKRPQVLA